jgi:hypothetical protein
MCSEWYNKSLNAQLNQIIYVLVEALWCVPVSLSVNLLEVNALVNNPMFGSCILKSWQANPDLVVEHPGHYSRKNHQVPHIHLSPSFCYQLIQAVYHPRCQYNILHSKRKYIINIFMPELYCKDLFFVFKCHLIWVYIDHWPLYLQFEMYLSRDCW